jgi:hypothetical protein
MKRLPLVIICWMLVFCSARPPGSDTIIRFKHLVGNKALKLFDETYTNSFGEPFVVSRFKYYIAQLSLTDNTGRQIDFPGNYWLVNEEDSLSKEIHLPVTSIITGISFVIGIDSIKNVSGIQIGSLDPANGMFWTWNSGYIFAKLEGQSDSSRAPAHSFSWDVGGFRQHENAQRKITLEINKNNTVARNTITIAADVLKWFNGKTAVLITQTPVCHQPGKLAGQIADNYSSMFSVVP